VTRGQTIALVGSTGFSVAPHVHYEVHEGGGPIDPLKYIFPDAIAD
jgi:murein DD-endopeptidase MepM/ murein hydrolase activator NlpD